MALKIVPISLKEGNAFVTLHHRHHKPTVGHKFSIGVEDDGVLVGAVIAGRPVARKVDFRKVLEVTRLVTDGTYNACSILYAAVARAAKAMGYEKVQTYILEEEPGVTLKAAGWSFEALAGGGDWNSGRGKRRKDQPMGRKQRWSKVLV